MTSILFCLDFSQPSQRPRQEVTRLAKAFAAEVHILHVAAPDPEFVGLEVGPQHVRDHRAAELRGEHRQLEQAVVEFKEAGITAHCHLVSGMTVETILERAKHWNVDLIVMGSHGYGTLKKAVLGSVSEGVLRNAECPVLILPRRVLARSDGTPSGAAVPQDAS